MSDLERRPLGHTGLEVTRLGFGALEIGRDWGLGDAQAQRKPTEEQAGLVLHGVLDLGVNLLDSARAYHRSEERIGNSLAQRRQAYVLATKCGEHSDEPRTYYDFSYRAVSASIDLSLRMLQTEVIDVLQIHFGPEPAKVLDDGETLRAMKDAREAGKVRFLGASPGHDLLERCIECGDFDVLQVGYSLLERGAHDLITKAGDRGIGILIRSGLGAGWLTARPRSTDCWRSSMATASGCTRWRWRSSAPILPLVRSWSARKISTIYAATSNGSGLQRTLTCCSALWRRCESRCCWRRGGDGGKGPETRVGR